MSPLLFPDVFPDVYCFADFFHLYCFTDYVDIFFFAGLDVTSPEPLPVDSPLLSLRNCTGSVKALLRLCLERSIKALLRLY